MTVRGYPAEALGNALPPLRTDRIVYSESAASTVADCILVKSACCLAFFVESLTACSEPDSVLPVQ